MCTALTLNNKKTFLFGRNLDLEASFGQSIAIVPRNIKFPMRFCKSFKSKYAMIGAATVAKDIENNNTTYPLFAEAANEKGLAAAGLNFPGTAFYPKPGSIKGAFEITPYELILYLLAQFQNTKEVKEFFTKNNVQIVNKPFSQHFPLAPTSFYCFR